MRRPKRQAHRGREGRDGPRPGGLPLGHALGHGARTHPDRVRRLVLEDPIGLEDYRVNIPPQTTATLTAPIKFVLR